MEKKQERILYIMTLLLDMSMFIVIPVLAVYLNRQLDFSVTEVGIVTSTGFLANIAGSIISGILHRRLSLKMMILLGILLQGAGMLLFTLSESILLLCLINGLIGFGYSLAVTNVQTVMSIHSTPESAKKVFSNRAVMSNIGISIGVLIGGALINYDGYLWAFVLSGLLAIINVLIGYWALTRGYNGQADTPAGLKPLMLTVVRDRKFMMFNIPIFGFWALFSLFLLNMPLFLNHNFPHINIGIIYVINTFGIAGLQVYLVQLFSKKWSSPQLIFLGCLVIAFSYLLLWLSNNVYLLIAAVIVFTIGEILSLPLIPAYVSSMVSGSMVSTYMGMMMVIRYLGFAFGNMLGGMMTDYVSTTSDLGQAWLLYFLFSVLVSCLFYFCVVYPKHSINKSGAAMEHK